MDFPIAAAIAACLAGAVASVAGFGIGSLLTPVLALTVGTKLAVAAVSIPHFIGTAIRCWMLRPFIDKKVLLNFGITSAIGGLLGALVHNLIKSASLTLIFGLVLILAGTVGITGWNEKARFKGWVASMAGAASGALGGMVGNQGGIRSAALLGFQLDRKAFVATATAIGLLVDVARMPVYFTLDMNELKAIWQLIAITTAGVVVGTLMGIGLLKNVPEQTFKHIVSAIILLLGVWMLLQKAL